MGAVLVLLAIGVYQLITLSREAATLSSALTAEKSFTATKQFEGTVGSLLIGGARLLLRSVKDVPPEASQALAAIRSASVGVYQLEETPTFQERRDRFGAGDLAMQRLGWMRVVSVGEKKQNVAVYLPANDRDDDELRVCLAVCDRRQLVVVSGRMDATLLAQFVQTQIPKFDPRN